MNDASIQSLNGLAISTSEERIVWCAIALTYLFYLTGTLYLIGSLVGWAIFAVFLMRWFVEGRCPKDSIVPVTVLVWIAGMIVMLLSLWVAHYDHNMGTGQTIKSTIGWAKGWALLALFPLLGAVVNVRPALISRSCCILTSQSLVFVPLGFVFYFIGMDGGLYISPLKAVGGPISTFEVGFYGINPETHKPRWPFFAPWAPAAGLLSCIYLVICSQERSVFWRSLGIAGAVVMCLFCQSRAGWVIFMMLIPVLIVFGRIPLPAALLMMGTMTCVFLLLGQPIIEAVADIHQQIKDSRPGSTRVRAALANIAIQRWESEAPLWGHGIVEKGPKIVEFMPIGSHHSWYGLLFVKGIVGLVALAVPMVLTVLYLMLMCRGNMLVWISLLIMLIITGYSFFENIEILAYLLWPALLWVGVTLNPLKDRGEIHE